MYDERRLVRSVVGKELRSVLSASFILFMCGYFWLTWDMEHLTIGRYILVLIMSPLTAYGLMSLIRDISRGWVRKSINEFKDMLNGEDKTN